MIQYLHFIDDTEAEARNTEIATEQGCGPITMLWFNKLSNPDGRRAFEVVDPGDESVLTSGEQLSLVDVLWFQNNLSGTIYADLAGLITGDGSIGDPVTLATIYSYLSTLAAGTVVNVNAGIYSGDFEINHDGVNGNPIEIRYDEAAALLGSLIVHSSFLDLWNVHHYLEPLNRVTIEPGSGPAIKTESGLTVYGADVRLLFPTIHDVVSSGIGNWDDADNALIHGAHCFNNGWQGPDRGHGHGIYIQGSNKLVELCVLGPGYGGSIRVFATSTTLQNITVTKTVCINDQLFVGGHTPAEGIIVSDNVVYNDKLEIGDTDDDNDDVTITGNYIVNNPEGGVFTLRFWKNITMTDNVFVSRSADGAILGELFPHAVPATINIDNNTYYIENPQASGNYFITYTEDPMDPNHFIPEFHTIVEWQALGYDVNSNFIFGLPVANELRLEQSAYDNEWLLLTVHNWEGLVNIDVDLTTFGLTLAKDYRFLNALNLNENHPFTYTGIVESIPASGWTTQVPSGAAAALYPHPAPNFLCFIIKPN